VKDELESRSSYMKQIMAEREKFGPMIHDLARQIASFQGKTIEHITVFLAEVERRLARLTDERMVLRGEQFAGQWPEKRLDAMREAAALHKELLNMLHTMDPEGEGWTARTNVRDELLQVVEKFDAIRPQVDARVRGKEEVARRLAGERIPFDWSLINAIQLVAVTQARYVLAMMLEAIHGLQQQMGDAAASKVEQLAEQALRFAFRCHQFAGGFDQQTTELFSKLSAVISPPEADANADE